MRIFPLSQFLFLKMNLHLLKNNLPRRIVPRHVSTGLTSSLKAVVLTSSSITVKIFIETHQSITKLAGIYLHIPFCKQACTYCNFHFSTSQRHKNEFVNALIKEIDLQKDFLRNQPVETIYFGGGTPSLLTIEESSQILEKIRKEFSIEKEAEITLEANPDDISNEKLSGWKDIGINRLSIGIQSFFDEDLGWMNRAHNQHQAYQSIEDSIAADFDNISIDLIYG